MLNISLIHFQPLEFFPPALNFIRYLSEQKDLCVTVFSSRVDTQRFRADLPENIRMKTLDLANYRQRSKGFRLLTYLHFTASCLRSLISEKPDILIYYDPYSALPGTIYHLLPKKKKAKLWIHFHEYFAPEWYANGMITARFSHFLEKKFVYRSALGISHTNPERIRLFLKDHPKVNPSILHSFPNYPPSVWQQHKTANRSWEGPIKMVALGSFTLRGTYLAEFCQWVKKKKGRVELDIYSLYFDKETEAFLEHLDCQWVRFHPDGIPYESIPGLFCRSAFHVGLVLYKCNHENTVQCVSNKVFEYLACEMDVWYPEKMLGTLPYATNGVYPKVLPVNFDKLDLLDLDKMICRDGESFKQHEFSSETVYSEWFRTLRIQNESE